MIFPDWGETAAIQTGTLPVYTEWAVDWQTGAFALRAGKPYTVSGAEALRVWVYLALHPNSCRFVHSAHSHAYGNQLAALLGETDRGILESQLRREIRETLLVSPYITAVDGFSCAFSGSAVEVRFTVHTVYEDFEDAWKGER